MTVMWRLQYCVWKQQSADYAGFLNMFVYLCRSLYVYKLTSFIYRYKLPSSSWKFRKTQNQSSEMLFNGHKLTDLLYLQDSLNGSEKAHQDLLSSFKLFTFLFNTVNFIFPYSSDFPCGENFKKSTVTSKAAGQRDETDVLSWYFTEIL